MLALTDIDLKQTRFYQDVLAQGIEMGRQEVRLEARLEGRREGESAVLLRLLTIKFGPPTPTSATASKLLIAKPCCDGPREY